MEISGYFKTLVSLPIHHNIRHHIPIIFNITFANFPFAESCITCSDFRRETPMVIRTHELSYPHPQGHVCLRLSSLSYRLVILLSFYNVRLVIIITEFPSMHSNLFCSPQLSLLMRITWTMYHSSNFPSKFALYLGLYHSITGIGRAQSV